MKFSRSGLALVVISMALPFSLAQAADLTPEDQQFLAGYEKVRASLAADDLSGAKMAASELGAEGAALAKSDKIEAARAELSKLSVRAIAVGKGRSGYYVVRCPMLKKDWLQPAGKISNPYAGASMPECGSIKK